MADDEKRENGNESISERLDNLSPEKRALLDKMLKEQEQAEGRAAGSADEHSAESARQQSDSGAGAEHKQEDKTSSRHTGRQDANPWNQANREWQNWWQNVSSGQQSNPWSQNQDWQNWWNQTATGQQDNPWGSAYEQWQQTQQSVTNPWAGTPAGGAQAGGDQDPNNPWQRAYQQAVEALNSMMSQGYAGSRKSPFEAYSGTWNRDSEHVRQQSANQTGQTEPGATASGGSTSTGSAGAEGSNWWSAGGTASGSDWNAFVENLGLNQRTGEGNGNGGSNSPLISLKPDGEWPPFFLIHAVFGSAFPYHRLAMHMDERQPVYGIQSIGLDGQEEPLEKIEDMAERYLELVQSVQKQGPYLLGGYSFGGWVAFQMARLLRQRGERVAVLAVLGTTIPTALINPMAFEELEKWQTLAKDYGELMFNAALNESQREQAVEWSKNNGLTAQQRVAWINYQSHLRYVPRPYAGHIDLFVTEDLNHMTHYDQSMGWRMLASEGVDTHFCSGNHISTFHEPHVVDLAEKLTACIERERKKGSG